MKRMMYSITRHLLSEKVQGQILMLLNFDVLPLEIIEIRGLSPLDNKLNVFLQQSYSCAVYMHFYKHELSC